MEPVGTGGGEGTNLKGRGEEEGEMAKGRRYPRVHTVDIKELGTEGSCSPTSPGFCHVSDVRVPCLCPEQKGQLSTVSAPKEYVISDSEADHKTTHIVNSVLLFQSIKGIAHFTGWQM